MTRRLMKSAIGTVLQATRADRLIARESGVAREPLVIGYHRVIDDRTRALGTPAMTVTCSMFERQLELIGRRYRFVSLDELSRRLEFGEARGTPVAAITFDDGYRDFYEHAFPILQRKGIPAAVFLVTDWIGSTSLFTHDRLYLVLARNWGRSAIAIAQLSTGSPAGAPRTPFGATRLLLLTRSQREIQAIIAALEAQSGPVDPAGALQPLDWEHVTAMHKAGVTIGSHTSTHAVLTNEPRAAVVDELLASRNVLGYRLQASVKYFSYPDGAFDPPVVAAVAAAGYRCAFTTCRHRDSDLPLLTIPRRVLWENSALDASGQFSPAVMSCLCCGVYDAIDSCRRRHLPVRVGRLRQPADTREIG